MNVSNKGQTNRLLGYPADARLLIVNADDFGMCHAVNEAVFRAFQNRVLRSATLMVPCPWALHAMHSLRLGGRDHIFDLMFKLAREYGLALWVYGQSSIEKVQSQGLPTNDYDFLDSYHLDPATKPARYAQMLRELPEGLSEWAIHPAIRNEELLAIEREDNHIRQTDFDFLMSRDVKNIVEEEGIILLDYRALQEVWKGK